jgi:hypothetical protein
MPTRYLRSCLCVVPASADPDRSEGWSSAPPSSTFSLKFVEESSSRHPTPLQRFRCLFCHKKQAHNSDILPIWYRACQRHERSRLHGLRRGDTTLRESRIGVRRTGSPALRPCLDDGLRAGCCAQIIYFRVWGPWWSAGCGEWARGVGWCLAPHRPLSSPSLTIGPLVARVDVYSHHHVCIVAVHCRLYRLDIHSWINGPSHSEEVGEYSSCACLLDPTCVWC